jgi:hypothetical protein
VTTLQARLATEPDYVEVLTDKTSYYGDLGVDKEHEFSWDIKALKEGTSQIIITLTGGNIHEKEIRESISIGGGPPPPSPSLTECKIDTDSDGIVDCMDECPYEKGDVADKGCPFNRDILTIAGVGAVVVVGGALILLIMRTRFKASMKSKPKSQIQICPHCKKKIQNAGNSCPYCGAYLDDTRAYDDTRPYDDTREY